jgi:uncharacterized membrane protein
LYALEIPAYSYLLADLHPHVFGIVNILILLVLIYRFFFENSHRVRNTIFLGIILGFSFVINSILTRHNCNHEFFMLIYAYKEKLYEQSFDEAFNSIEEELLN